MASSHKQHRTRDTSRDTAFIHNRILSITDRVELITSDEAGKLYSATISPKAAWALFAMNKALSQNMRPGTSRVGKQIPSRILVLINRPLCCRSDLILGKEPGRIASRNSAKYKKNRPPRSPAALSTRDDALRLTCCRHRVINAGWNLSRQTILEFASAIRIES